MLSWRDGKNVPTVHVHDYENRTAYAIVSDETAGARHASGTVRRIG
jgi:hypothetical protein